MNSAPRSQRLYWSLQVIGWTTYGLVGFATGISFNQGVPTAKVAAISLAGSVTLLGLTHLLRGIAKRHQWIRLSFGKLIWRLLLGTFSISVISQIFVSVLMFWPLGVITDQRPYSVGILGLYIFQTQVILLLWALIYSSYHAARNSRRAEVEKWQLQAAVANAELGALKAQINPHFLFNCLNNIRSLVIEDAEKARSAIGHLSELLRGSIQSNKASSIPLADELAMVRDYLALEAIHMEERLRFSIAEPAESSSLQVPPMCIQLLVENAIKHGLARRPSGGQVDISIQQSDTHLQIDVCNSGQLSNQPASPAASTGTGLANLRERLRLQYGSAAIFELANNGPEQVRARIALPLALNSRISERA